MTVRLAILGTAILLLGVGIGGYLFRDTQPRSFLTFDQCQARCFAQNELLGLLGSVGIQQTSGLIPNVVAETDSVVALKHPLPEYPTHYVIVPKTDIRDAADLTSEDAAVLSEMFAVIGELIRRDELKAYRLITNGPDYQHATYLHFHLISNERSMN